MIAIISYFRRYTIRDFEVILNGLTPKITGMHRLSLVIVAFGVFLS